jgi:endonuclease/exonuclease/phosphatase (EEP) superfamily protein YafD
MSRWKAGNQKLLSVARLTSAALAAAYVAALFGWYIAGTRVGDASALWYSLNAVALYFFVLLPVVLLVAVLTRHWLAGGSFVLGLALWLHLWGALFWPLTGETAAPDEGLTVMTYNVLGFVTDPAPAVASIRASGADVIALQELNPAVAAAIERELINEYPYQFLSPADGVVGMGVITKVPASLQEHRLAHAAWVGGPQLVSLEHDGERVLVLNVHSPAQSENNASHASNRAGASWISRRRLRRP